MGCATYYYAVAHQPARTLTLLLTCHTMQLVEGESALAQRMAGAEASIKAADAMQVCGLLALRMNMAQAQAARKTSGMCPFLLTQAPPSTAPTVLRCCCARCYCWLLWVQGGLRGQVQGARSRGPTQEAPHPCMPHIILFVLHRRPTPRQPRSWRPSRRRPARRGRAWSPWLSS